MDYSIYQVDAFTDSLFKGNPACVVPLDRWLEDDVLLNVAKENGVPETAFFIKKNNEIHLRWFTPDIEMDLCGHATIATAHVIKKHLHYQGEILNFKTLSGDVKVSISNDKYFLDFPSRIPVDNSLPNNLKEALNLIDNNSHNLDQNKLEARATDILDIKEVENLRDPLKEPSDNKNLLLIFSGPCWVEIYTDNEKPLIYKLYNKNEVLEIDIKKSFTLVIGNIDNVNVDLSLIHI